MATRQETLVKEQEGLGKISKSVKDPPPPPTSCSSPQGGGEDPTPSSPSIIPIQQKVSLKKLRKDLPIFNHII